MINPFKKTYTLKEQDIFLFLTKMRIFSDLNYKQLYQFIPHMHERSYVQDEVVFFRNDPSHALYLLKKGEVSLNIDVNDTFEILTKVKSGASLGESCLIKNRKRQLNAFVTSETAEFYVIPQENIFSIFDDNPKIKTKMVEALAGMYSDYNASIFKTYKSSLGFFNLKQVYKED
jgi:CRP/FNR family cyclic AMP-dependent transcriptional regulator